MRLILLVCFALIGTIIHATPWTVSASSTDEVWVILNARVDKVLPNVPHGLKNTSNNKMLVKQKQRKGINLGWATPSNFDQTFTFYKENQSTTPVKYKESIALNVYLNGEKYLYYKRGAGGIELAFSETPVYEWYFTGGTDGEPVLPRVKTKSGDRDVKIGLYNKRKGASLIYGESPDGRQQEGVSLRWSKRVKVKKDPTTSGKCTILVIVTGTYSKHTDAIGAFKSVSGKRGDFLQKFPVNTVRDHRKEKQAQPSQQSRINLAAGEYFLVPSGGGQDKQGYFGNIFEPRQKQINCQPGRTQRVLFKTNFAEY
jgi:hypothetical protein